METATSTTVKQMTWETNYNNKLGCEGFIHVDVKPKMIPSYDVLDKMVFEILTQDNSYPPIKVKLLAVLVFQLDQLPDQIALPSHGMTAMELADFHFKRYPTWMSLKTAMAIYYYKKIH